MAYPTQERLKNLIETVNGLEQSKYSGHPYDDAIFTGVVRNVVDSGQCQQFHLEVCPLPLDVKDNGDLTFCGNDHPLKTVEDADAYAKVYVQNVPQAWISLYYRPGDIIRYWRYTASDTDGKKVRGTFVTLKDDLSFFAKITWPCGCGASSTTSSGEGCTANPLPTTDPTVQWTYKFEAIYYLSNAYSTNVADRFPPYQCYMSGITGDCFNLAEVYNGSGNTGTGVKVKGSGVRADVPDGSPDVDLAKQQIIPVGTHVNKVYPLLNVDSGVCRFTDFYFVLGNQFAEQNSDPTKCCPPDTSSSSSSSSSSTTSSSSSSTSSSSSSSSSSGGCCPCPEAFTGTQDVVVDWNPSTCQVTKKTFTYKCGVLMSIT